MNNHINTQFGFDYSYDEEFFKLIGVETKSEESGRVSYSYDNYDFVPYDKNGKDGGYDYDEEERNGVVNKAPVNIDKKKNSLPDEGGKRQKGRIIIEEYEDSDEYDKNDADNDFNSKENDVMDENLVLKESKDDKLKDKAKDSLKHNKDYNYVNDYDETHERNSDDDISADKETEEDDEEEYDEDYNYEGDESEERDEDYIDRGQDEVNPDESIEKNENLNDYYDNNDFGEGEDNGVNKNANGDDGIMEELEEDQNSVRKDFENEIMEM